MNKRRNRIVFLSLVLVLLASSVVLADEDISVKNWQVDSEILEDGSLSVVEDISFYFNSDFNGVYKDIVLTGTKGIENLEIQEIKPNKLDYKKVENAKNGDTNVYTVDKEEDSISIKIFSPSEYEEKTFRFSYTMLDVANNYGDVSEFTYKFIGDENSSYIENLNIDIKLPRKLNDQVKIFGHGYNQNTINFKGDDKVTIKGEHIPSESLVEARILMPLDFLPKASLRSSEDMLEILLKQEESYLKEEERSRTIKAKREKGVKNLSIVSIGLASILAVYSYLKNRHNLEPYEDKLRGNLIVLPPAIITHISRMPFDSNMIIASIYSLSYKGYLSIEEAEPFTKKHSKEEVENFRLKLLDGDRSKLLDHEEFLIDWLFNDIGNGESLTSEDIYRYTSKNESKFTENFTKWCQLVSEDTVTMGLKDNSKKKLGIGLIIFSILLLFLSIFNFIIYRNILKGSLLIILFLILLILGIELTQRLTDLGHLQYTKLMDFKKDLMKERINITDESLLIMAMALGLGPNKLVTFKENFSNEDNFSSSWLYWYFLMNSSGQNVFAESITSSSGLSDINSDIGSGGGFTSGGGSGAGGGGVGGF